MLRLTKRCDVGSYNINTANTAHPKTERSGSPNHISIVAIVGIVIVALVVVGGIYSRPGHVEVPIPYVQTNTMVIRHVPTSSVPFVSIDPRYHRKISPSDEKFVLSQSLISVVNKMSLNLEKDYGWNKPACTYDPRLINDKPLEMMEWLSRVSPRIHHGILDASDELAHEIRADILDWRVPLGDRATVPQEFHALSVFVRADKEDYSLWRTRCLPDLVECPNVYHVFVSFWGPGIEEAYQDTGNPDYVTFVKAPKEIGTRYFMNTSLIQTPFILSLDGDRCARCDSIRLALKELAVDGPIQDDRKTTKVVAGGVSLRGLTPFKNRANPEKDDCRYFPDWYGTRKGKDFAAYFLPTNAIYAKRYLEYYRDMVPPKLIALVNDMRQCEDLLMSFFQLLFQVKDQKHALTPFLMMNGIGFNITNRPPQVGKHAIRPKCLDFMLTLSMKFGIYPHALAYKF